MLHIKTTANKPIEIISVGIQNHDSGPDFFNAKIRIDNQVWAGNVEIHVKSSDWYLHQHEKNIAYDSVILHVVFKYDSDVFRTNDTVIPTLELKPLIHQKYIANYNKLLLATKSWINCESELHTVDDFVIKHWLERLYFERLEEKATYIESILKKYNYDWEAVLFKLLAKNFGLRVNGDAFYSIANSFDFSLIRKTQTKLLQLEALFFGQAGWLQDHKDDAYYSELQNEYQYLKQKFQLKNIGVIPCQFFRLRPANFPTIRLVQLAKLYHNERQLFSKVIHSNSLNELHDLFAVTTSSYWETHYTFLKASKRIIKSTSHAFINLLLINTILPLKFHYAKYLGKSNDELIISIISSIDSESNTLISKYKNLGVNANSALETQGIIHLKTKYCDANRCLNCAVGNSLLGK